VTTRSYATPIAFKQALEERLRNASSTGVDFARRRQLLVFDRFLARAVAVFGDALILKGGFALELRIDKARTTKDIVLAIVGSPNKVLGSLQAAGRADLGDFMTFEVQRDRRNPRLQGDALRYEGQRYRALCRLAGVVYGQPFGIDVGFGDPLVGTPEVVVADDILAFAGIAATRVRLYPVVTHISEKVHAYTMPRDRANTRVRDLPDIALLASTPAIRAVDLREALAKTFAFRDTHGVPLTLPAPPRLWEEPYQKLARDNHLGWRDLESVAEATGLFLNPLLANAAVHRWDHVIWRWK